MNRAKRTDKLNYKLEDTYEKFVENIISRVCIRIKVAGTTFAGIKSWRYTCTS